MKTGINIILLTALVSAIVGEIQSTDPTEKYQFALIAFIVFVCLGYLYISFGTILLFLMIVYVYLLITTSNVSFLNDPYL